MRPHLSRATGSQVTIQLAHRSLWPTVVERVREAVRGGSIEPIDTEIEHVEDGGVRFVIRVVSSVARKERAKRADTPVRNPFLPPYDLDLFVADVSDTHVCLLNKYNVFEHHLLIVTRAFEDQRELLTFADFEALCACMEEVDGLAFYNAGPEAGASQPHKHLQLVPVPLNEGPARTPIEHGLRAGTLPFAHAAAPWESDPAKAHDRYLSLLRAIHCDRHGTPYNLLATREWMLAVPRTREKYGDISVNALGFAGSLLAGRRAQLETLRRAGPMTVLCHVSRHGGEQD